MNCPNCAAANADEARFCNRCGASMSAPAPAVAPAPPPPAQASAPLPPPLVPVAVVPASAPRSGMPGWLIGCLIAAIVGLVVIGIGAGVAMYLIPHHHTITRETTSSGNATAVEEPSPGDANAHPSSGGIGGGISGGTTGGGEVQKQAEVAAARSVLDQYFAAEKVRDSHKMATFLTGEAASQFDATQTANDTEIKSVAVTSMQADDEGVVLFTAKMDTRELEAGEDQMMTITGRMIKMDSGWKISEIAYN
jgi:hypothetical protein